MLEAVPGCYEKDMIASRTTSRSLHDSGQLSQVS